MDDTLSTEINCPMEALIICHPIRQSPPTHPLDVPYEHAQLSRVCFAKKVETA